MRTKLRVRGDRRHRDVLEPLRVARDPPAPVRRALPRARLDLYATKVTPDGKCPPLVGRLARLREVQASFPELAEPAGERIEELVELMPKLADPVERAALRTGIAREIGELDAALEGQTWLGGDTFSLADVMWTATLARCEMQKITPWEDGSLPNVARYYAALKSRPSYREEKVVDHMPASLGGAPAALQPTAAP